MRTLGRIHRVRKEPEQAVAWFTKGSEAGLPDAMYALGTLLDMGDDVTAPDSLAAADWFRRAADAGHGAAAENLTGMYTVGRGRAWLTMPASSCFKTLVA
jgi:hypothetical protein